MFSTVEDGMGRSARGCGIVSACDDEDRRTRRATCNAAADQVTPGPSTSMTKYPGRAPDLHSDDASASTELKIPMMVRDNTAPMGTASPRPSTRATRCTTGTSAYDRAVTILFWSPPGPPSPRPDPSGPHEPLRAAPAACCVGGAQRGGGRSGPAGRLLSRRASYCEVLDGEGRMARVPELAGSRGTRPKMITIKDPSSTYRGAPSISLCCSEWPPRGSPPRSGSSPPSPTSTTVYRREHMALVMGDVSGDEPVSSACTPSASPATCSAHAL